MHTTLICLAFDRDRLCSDLATNKKFAFIG